MKFSDIYLEENLKVYLNGNPVWDYKLSGDRLELISFQIEEELEVVTLQELAEYLAEEEREFESVEVLNEESGNPILDFDTKFGTLFLSNLVLK